MKRVGFDKSLICEHVILIVVFDENWSADFFFGQLSADFSIAGFQRYTLLGRSRHSNPLNDVNNSKTCLCRSSFSFFYLIHLCEPSIKICRIMLTSVCKGLGIFVKERLKYILLNILYIFI